ncbi:MAG: family 10 glycosylhydrolase [bacterium]
MVRKTSGLVIMLLLILGGYLYAADIVVDNTSTGFSYFGDWALSSSAGTKYGADYYYAITTTNISAATAYAIWRPTIPVSTSYQVWVWYGESSNRPVDAKYYVYHAAGVSCFYANQTINGGQWCLLGTFRFLSGTTGYVKLTNYSSTNSKAVIADAVRFVSYSPPPIKTGGEFRAYWADSWGSGLLTPSQVTAMIDTARRYNFNAVLPEVRKIGDAYFRSAIEPWATNISPSNHDILSTMIQYAHNTTGGKPYIEVHAWMVTYRDWVTGSSMSDTSRHIFWKHPEWFTKTYTGATASGSSMFLDPAIPEVEDYLTNVYLDIIKHYNVDGISYDYVRYAGTEWGYNSLVSTRFYQEYSYAPPTTSSQAGWSTWCQYRRDAVTALIKKVYVSAMEINPNVKVSGAMITWYPYNTDFSQTRAYYEVYQDWHKWMYDHILDASAPMSYFDNDSYPTTFKNWALFAVNSSYGRHAYIGPGIYLNSTTNTATQIFYCRATAHAQGVIDYSYQETNDEGVSNTAFYTMMSSRFYSTVTNTPDMPWKSQPTTGILKGHAYDTSLLSPVPYFNGKVIYKARIVARNESTLAAWTTMTDGTGFYAFLDLPPGNYTVTAYKPTGYTTSVAYTGKPIFAGLVSNVDVYFDMVPVTLSRFEISRALDNKKPGFLNRDN